MNKIFKAVFNRSRQTMTVVSEISSGAKKKSVKTVVAAAVVSALSCGVAAGATYELTNAGPYDSTSAESPAKEFKAEDVLNINVASDVFAYGLVANEGHQYTNNGVINVNGSRARAMRAFSGATVVNNGTIDVTKGIIGLCAYSTSNATLINNGTIDAQYSAIYLAAESQGDYSNNKILLGANSVTKGNVVVTGWAVNNKWENRLSNTVIQIDNGAQIDGRIIVEGATGTKLNGTFEISKQKWTTGGAVWFIDDSDSSEFNLTNSNFTDNEAVSASPAGGAMYMSVVNFKQTGGSYIGNQVKSVGEAVSNNDIHKSAVGGAMFNKGSTMVMTDVDFDNNVASAVKGENANGGYLAFGGALFIDYSTGTGSGTGNLSEAEITFNITKDMVYTGNDVSSEANDSVISDGYGYTAKDSSGGFMFLDRGSDSVFNIAKGATLTIGVEGTTGETDSIASSIPTKGTQVNKGKHATITKIGEGTLLMNGSLNNYFGTVDVNAGVMSVTSDWKLKNTVTIKEGATLALKSFDILTADKTGNSDVEGNQVAGKLTVNGTLQTSSDQLFTQALDAGATVKDAGKLKYENTLLVLGTDSTLALTDAKYNLDYVKSADKLAAGSVAMLGDLIDEGVVDNNSSLDKLDGVGPNTALDKVTVVEDGNIQIGGSAPSDKTTEYRKESLSVGAVDLGQGNKLTITGGKTLTLSGNGSEIIKSGKDTFDVVISDKGTLALGRDDLAHGGEINGTVKVEDGSYVNVSGGENFILKLLEGAGKVLVGNAKSAGALTVRDLSGMTGLIFVDPAWGEGVTSVNGASKFDAYELGTGGLAAKVVAGQNSVVAIQGKADVAIAAFQRIAAANDLTWGKDGVTAAVYLEKPLKLATDGALVANGVLASEPSSVDAGVNIAKQGMLIVNQANAGEGAYITGNVTFKEGSYLGLSNAREGSFKLASGTLAGQADVVTDNPFIDAGMKDGVVSAEINVDNGLQALASAGIQAMTRNADAQLAETIADRTSIDQQLGEGANLWVNVGGMSYDVDGMDLDAEFKADIGYGAFGGEVAFGDSFTAGAAFQYGKGSLRSPVAKIKNEIDNYGFTVYATKSFGDAKIVGELAYVQSDNDISSSQAAMNQSVDAKMYSAGVRAQYQWKVGGMNILPSVGLRVSKIDTDAMQVGSIRVDDQDQTLVQVPLTVRLSADNQQAGGWTFTPTAKVAFVPTFGDKEITVFGHDQDVIDTMPVNGQFGLQARNGNLLADVTLSAGFGQDDAKSFGGKIGVKYMF